MNIFSLLFRIVRYLVWRSFLWLCLLMVGYLLAIRLAVVFMPYYQQSVLSFFQKNSQVPFTIGKISISENRISPTIQLENIRIESNDDSIDLAIDVRRAEGHLNLPKSLIYRQPIFDQLFVFDAKIDSAIYDLSFFSDTQESDNEGFSALVRWFEKQPNVFLTQFSGQITQADKAWQFNELEAFWFKSDQRYLNILQEGSSLIKAHYRGSIYNLSSSKLQARGRINPGPLINTLLNQNNKMDDASMAFYVQADKKQLKFSLDAQLSNYIYRAYRDVQLSDVAMPTHGYYRFGAEVLAFSVQPLKGMINGELVESSIEAEYDLKRNEILALRLDKFEIDHLLQLAQFELEREFQELIPAFNPTGRIQRLEILGQTEALEDLVVSANIKGLSVNQVGEFPGVQDLDFSITGLNEQLVFAFKDEQLKLDYPLFDQTFELGLKGNLVFKPWQEFWKLSSDKLQIDDQYQSTRLIINVAREGLNELNLGIHAESALEDMTKAKRYVPMQLLSSDLANWFRKGFKAGVADRISLLYQGNVLEPELPNDPDRLSVGFWVNQTDIDFLPDWPHLEQVNGRVILNGPAEFSIDSLRFLGARFGAAQGEIANDGVGTRLSFPEMQFKGSVDSMLVAMREAEFFTQTIPADILDLEWQGPIAGRGSMDIPFYDSRAIEVVIDADVVDNNMRWKGFPAPFTDIRGGFYLNTLESVELRNLKGKTVDADFVASMRYGFTDQQVTASGWMPAVMPAKVATLYFPNLQSDFDRILLGKTSAKLFANYDGNLNQGELMISSPMKGVEYQLPSPFGKPAQQKQRAVIRLPLGNAELPAKAWLGPHSLAAKWQPDGALAGMSVGVNQPQPPLVVAESIQIDGDMYRLSIVDWLDFLAKHEPQQINSIEQQKTSPYWLGLPMTVNLAVDHVTASENWTLSEMQIDVQESPLQWAASSDSADLVAEFIWPKNIGATTTSSLTVETITLPYQKRSGAPQKEAFVSSYGFDDWGQIDTQIKRLNLGDQHLGQLSFIASLSPDEVQINSINGQIYGFDILGDARWTERNGVLFNELTGVATASNFEQIIGFNQLPKFASGGGPVELEFSAFWPGRMESARLDNIEAALRFHSGAGSFNDVPNSFALKALSIFNVANWQRRLRLDFGDLYAPGIGFDRIDGLMRLSEGKMQIEHARIEGIAISATMQGELDLLSNQVDVDAQVELPLNVSDPVTCVAALPVCFGGFVWELFTDEALHEQTKVNYHVSGTVKSPKFTPIKK
ncbi:MAG: AsmA-like C-terminal region-containing protein [Pseudomonadota bacterium]|nr:AsmA-like C-terminal region-containing protein [Pseudomonadota bacterium]